MRESRPCPCQFEEIGPCVKDCTCVNPVSSYGCLRCPRYGSREQQLSVARYIAGLISKDERRKPKGKKTAHKHEFGAWHCRGGSPEMIRVCLIGECQDWIGMDGKIHRAKKPQAESRS